VKLAARAFYDNISMKGDSIPKSFRGDNRGIGVVVLDALTRFQRELFSIFCA
jgi:transcription initiation factor TFIIE subunit alpha